MLVDLATPVDTGDSTRKCILQQNAQKYFQNDANMSPENLPCKKPPQKTEEQQSSLAQTAGCEDTSSNAALIWKTKERSQLCCMTMPYWNHDQKLVLLVSCILSSIAVNLLCLHGYTILIMLELAISKYQNWVW